MRVVVPPLPLRRVANPLWLPAAVVLTLLLLPFVGVGALFALRPGPHRLLRLSAMALVYLWVDVCLVVTCWWLWLRDPSPRRDVTRWHRQHGAVLQHALTVLMDAARVLLGFHVEIDDAMPPGPTGRPMVVLARHAGPGDSFTIVHLLLRRYARRPKVVLKAALQLDPGLDILLNRLDCYFLPSTSGAGDDRTAAVRELTLSLTPEEALLIFPEGGNWTPRRYRRAVRRLFQRGHVRRAQQAAAHPHVLPPKPGGALACLTARTDTDVAVVAHTGLDTLVNPAQMWAAVPVDRQPMRVHWWTEPAAEVPRDPDLVLAWLDQRWARVDEWVAGSADQLLPPSA